MFDYLKFRWALAKEERSRNQTAEKYRKDIQEAKSRKGSAESLESIKSSAHFEDDTYQEEIYRLHTSYLYKQANKLMVPVPPHSDRELWAEEYGFYWLTTKGINELRAAIRQEKKIRREAFLMWVPLLTAATGVTGAIIGLVAFLSKIAPTP